jgi:malonyl-CoA O-methyltransferase
MLKSAVAHNFGLASPHYDAQASLQALVAQQLAQAILASHPASGLSVLEIGGGTGGLTRHLLPTLCPSMYLFSDLSWPMVRRAQWPPEYDALGEKRAVPPPYRLVMDGELPALPPASVDLVVSSLAVQWFSQPAISLPGLLRVLKPGGQLWISTLVQSSFDQWRRDCDQAALPTGIIPLLSEGQLVDMLSGHASPTEVSQAEGQVLGQGAGQVPPQQKGQVSGQLHKMLRPYASALAFLQNLRAIGAHHPAADHRPVNAGRLRQLLKTLPTPYPVDYHVWIGCVTV